MSDGIGEGRTREDHGNISSQLYALYAQTKRVERLASILGEEGLSHRGRLFLKVFNEFESRFVQQAPFGNRTIVETLRLGWELSLLFPERELTRLKPEQIQTYRLPPDESDTRSEE